MLKVICLVCLVVVLPVISASQSKSSESSDVVIPNGFMRAGEFVKLTQEQRDFYTVGFIDGLLVSTMMGADLQRVRALKNCTTGMKSSQIAEIIRRYVDAKPEIWHHELHTESVNALASVCPDIRAQ